MVSKSGDSYNLLDEKIIRDRAIRLFTYLREITELNAKTIRISDQYEKVLWFDDIPREIGCHCIAWGPVDEEKSDVWIEIRKPRLKAAPEVPEVLKPWLDLREVQDSSLEFPDLRQRITVNAPSELGEGGKPEPQTIFKDLADCPEIKTTWEQYVERKWWPWAEEDRRLQKVQKVYTDLFSIYQKQQRLGEAYEVVLGLSYLAWKAPSGHEVKRHIITGQTSLIFDAPRGVITFGPAGEGAKPTLKQDMLEPQERPDPKEQNAINRQVEEISDALWDGIQIQVALKAWVNAVSSYGEFDNTLTPLMEVGRNPKIHLAPAVILRKRTERSLLRVLQEIIEQLRSGHPIPLGVERLVKIVDDSGASSNIDIKTDDNNKLLLPLTLKEIYFPLPANKEQLEIAEKLSTRQGVLVQGPPGTGKSHTIANLVCHLLAMGQRVLVASHTARALKVLRNKFPKEIAELCVILLGDDLNAMQSLEDSVRGISERYNTWDEKKNQQLIMELEKKLYETRKAEASTLSDLQVIREAETYQHPLQFETYEGTLQSIANRLRLEEPLYKWITIQPIEEDKPPLSNEETIELVKLLRGISKVQEEELRKNIIDPDSLISVSEFVDLVRNEAEARALYEAAAANRSHPCYLLLAKTPKDQRDQLKEGLSELRTAYEALSKHIQPWVRQAALQILTDQDRHWYELLSVTREHLGLMGDRVRRASERQITGLGERTRGIVKTVASALLQHLEAGGRLGFGPFRPKVVKDGIYLIKQVRVDGQLCDKQKPLRNLLEWIEIADHLNALRVHWSKCIGPRAGHFSEQVAEYQDLCKLLERTLELKTKIEEIRQIISTIPGFLEPNWHELKDLLALQDAIEAVRLEEELKQVKNRFDDLERHLHTVATSPSAHRMMKEAFEVVQKRDEERYAVVYEFMERAKRLSKVLKHRDSLLQRLETAAPELTSQIISSFAEHVWDNRMAKFKNAWNWARANQWLSHLNDSRAQQRLSNTLDIHRSRIRELIRDLAAAKAWRHCFSRLTEHERQNLMAWTKAMRRIGKGTGKYAPMHRRAARKHMDECRSAIPGWIMPIYRVAETIHPGTDRYDVVIVDEASQSGPEALFLHYLAKRIVVVGDDKQISPEFVGITREDVELLRQRHISDIPHSDALGVDNSFFDQAEIRYGDRIRLREHFRCMPEIIQFSNNLCYRSEPLIPLRQYGAGRITPVIVTHHVQEGYQQGHSPRVVNQPEAQAVVDQIKKCCEDSIYDGKTMGVISLLGEDQAKLIEKLLLEKIGPEEMEKRHLVCGDAYAFQGDERDAMFLSLVSAPMEGHWIHPLASPRDERRFNVAVSRARDQMWLFHTATINDLSPNCFRYRLLQYCQNPQVQPITTEGLDIQKLRTTAQTTDRDRVNPPSPFDSWFEIDVFLKIAERGYRVIPQFEIAGYRIDLVIEGIEGRLAVECDGDTWHGVERFQEDMARQRMLERCGLTFWRVRGGTFYRDPDAALGKLWSTLDQLKIFPKSQGRSPDDSNNVEQTGFRRKGFSAEEFQDISFSGAKGEKEEISGDKLKSNKIDKINFGEKEPKSKPIDEGKKISLDNLIPIIIKILRRHGGRALKAEVEREIYVKLKYVFDTPWYQEIVSSGVARWKYDITLAKEVAKSKGLIKRPEHSRKGYWELTERGKK
jgi:very-short-patch-repair endonuclease